MSSLEVIQFHVEHLPALGAIEAMCGRGIDQWVNEMAVLDGAPGSWTLLDGEPVMCAGSFVVDGWPGRAIAWAMVRPGIRLGALLCATRLIKRGFVELLAGDIRRIETTVLETFEQGHHWARMIGLKSEGLLHRYDPMGRDHRQYSLWKQ